MENIACGELTCDSTLIENVFNNIRAGDFYAGIGSRETPMRVMEMMTAIATCLSVKGVTLRSGGALGADTAFSNGAGPFQITYLPWRGFNGNSSLFYRYTAQHKEMAKSYHPNWARLSNAARAFMVRNTAQIWGDDFSNPVKMVICWTRDGKDSGGTGQAIRIACANGIPVFNLFYDGVANKIAEMCK